MPTIHPPQGACIVTTRPAFRFAVIGEHIASRADLVRTAQTAERLGYATLLLRDHFVEEPFGHQFAPIAALATAAAVTERLPIGTLVFANDYHPPVLLAKDAATLDVLSGGRFELGIGTGFLREEYMQAGIPFDAPGVRVSRFEEALQILRGLWGRGPFTFHGTHYRLDAFDSFPKPVQDHLPILVGAGGKRMLRIAARHADAISILTVSTTTGAVTDDPAQRTAAAVAEKIGWIRDAAGDRFDRIELSMVGTFLITEGDDAARAAAQVREERGWHALSLAEVREMPALHIGTIDQIVDIIRYRREQFGISYWVVSDTQMDAVAPIVARLTGT